MAPFIVPACACVIANVTCTCTHSGASFWVHHDMPDQADFYVLTESIKNLARAASRAAHRKLAVESRCNKTPSTQRRKDAENIQPRCRSPPRRRPIGAA